MKKVLFPLALTAVALTTACNDDEVQEIIKPDSEKEMISFSMSDAQGAMTRAGFTGAATDIVMHIESYNGTNYRNTKTLASADKDNNGGATDYSNVSFNDAYKRYWDDAHGRASKLSIFAVAVANKPLSATSLAETSLTGDGTWTADNSTRPEHKITWNVSTGDTKQSSTTLENEDLVYSNNIQQNGKDGVYWFKFTNSPNTGDGTWMPGEKPDITDAKTGAQTHGGNYGESTAENNLKDGRLLFRNATTDPSSVGKFDRGHMNFTHSLSRISVTLKEGTGFKSDANTDFVITDDGVQMIAMNVTGTLNILDGNWTATTPAATDITKLTASKNTENVSSITAAGQFIPGDVFCKDNTTNVMKFKIDGNDYFITEHMIWEALSNATDGSTTALTSDAKTAAGIASDKVTLIQGYNYKFSIIVDKKQIETVTATLVDWSNIEAQEFEIDNGHINISTHQSNSGTNEIDNFSSHRLYRLREAVPALYIDDDEYTANKYQGKYGDEVTPTQKTVNSTKYWSTSWYYEDNYTAYHIRSLNQKAAESKQLGSADSDKSYFTIENGAQATHDYHWGAPLANATGSVTIDEVSKNIYKYDETDGTDDDNMAEGYKALLYKGITATNKDQIINLTEFHMMANINVIVKTVNDGGKVNLGDCSNDDNKTKVEILRLYDRGQVDMGIGAITITKTNPTDGSASNYLTESLNVGVKKSETMTPPSTTTDVSAFYEDGSTILQTKPFSFAVVPQPLCRAASTPTDTTPEDQYIGIRIKTPDNNEYYVVKKLYDIVATSVGTSANQTQNSAIHYWYPNHTYTYTITISKKQIEAITCTLADWVEVVAKDTKIDLES